MRKIISKIAGLVLGLSLAAGVGVVSFSKEKTEVRAGYEETSSIAVGDTIVLANTTASKEFKCISLFGSTYVGESVEYTGSTPAGVYPFTVVQGSASTNFAFKTSDNKYLTWTSGNSLNVADSISANTSWTIENVSGKGIMLQNASNSSRRLSYNSGSPRFATYGNTGQSGINIFKYVDDTATKYTISYDSNGGTGTMESTVASAPVIANCTFTAPSGKKFGSWNTAADGSGTSYNPGVQLTKNESLYAIWVDVPEYTCAQAISAIQNSGETTGVHVSGYISSIVSGSVSGGKLTYWLSDTKGGSDQFEVYLGLGLNKEAFTAVTDIEVGAFVKVFGDIVLYGSTYEFSNGNYLVSYSAPVPVLSSIALSGTYQTAFEQGDVFSSEGLVVTATYDTGTSQVVIPTSISSPDMSTFGEQTVTVSYTEDGVTKTAEYTITISAVTVKHTISFLPGEGSGTMASVEVSEGSDYTLPDCSFTAPEGKVFAGWSLNGTDIVTSLESVTSDVSVTALWEDKPAEATTDYDFSSSIPEEWVASMDKTTTDTSLGRGIGWGAAKGEITLTLENSDKVSSVVITASTNNTGNTLSVAVGGTDYGSAQEIANGTDNKNKEYTFEGSSSGNIVITVNDSAKTVYILQISVTIVGGTPAPEKVLTGITVSGAKTEFNVGDAFVTTGLVVTAHYEDAADAVITSGYTVDSSLVDTAVAGTYTITVTYQTESDTYDVTYSTPAPATIATYKKVETNLADFSGSYLIVYESSETAGYAFNGSLTTFDATGNGVAVEISSGIIELSDEYEFTVAKKEGGYSLESKSGYYLGKTAYANGIDQSETDKYTNQIEYSEGVMAVHSEGNSSDDYVVLRYNATSGQNRFRFMKNNGVNPISLYQKVDDAEALALDLLNMTSDVCSAGYDNKASDFADAWTSLSSSYNALDADAKSKLASVVANKNGVMLEESMARYDLLTGKYGLTNFISGRTPAAGAPYVTISMNSNSSTIVIVVVALTSISSIGVLLVIKRKRSLVK